MKKWFFRIGGAVGMGLTWAVGWAIVGVLMAFITGLLAGHLQELGPDPWMALAMPGFFDGGIFGFNVRHAKEKPIAALLYLVDQNYWNRGIATEAATTAVNYAFNELNITHIKADVIKANIASIRVLEKIGMVCYKSDARKRYYHLETQQLTCKPRKLQKCCA